MLRLREKQRQCDFRCEDTARIVTTKRDGRDLMFRAKLLIDEFGKGLATQ